MLASRDNLSHKKLALPDTKPKDSKGAKRPHWTEAKLKTIETLFAFLPPLAVPFSAQVRAEILSPSRRTERPERPRQRYNTSDNVAPMNSAQFWLDESDPKPSPSRDTAMPPTHCGSCSPPPLHGIPKRIPTPEREASNRMTNSAVEWVAKERKGLAKAFSSIAMAHNMARHRRTALLAGTPSFKLACRRRPFIVPKSA